MCVFSLFILQKPLRPQVTYPQHLPLPKLAAKRNNNHNNQQLTNPSRLKFRIVDNIRIFIIIRHQHIIRICSYAFIRQMHRMLGHWMRIIRVSIQRQVHSWWSSVRFQRHKRNVQRFFDLATLLRQRTTATTKTQDASEEAARNVVPNPCHHQSAL